MKKLFIIYFIGLFMNPFLYAQVQIKSYTVEKFDGTQYVKQDSIDYLWTTNQDDKSLLNIFTGQRNPLSDPYLNNFNEKNTFTWSIQNSVYLPKTKIVQILNTLGQVEKQITQGLVAGSLVNESKGVYLYDQLGNIKEERYESWVDSAWKSVRKNIRIYSNNQLDTLILETLQSDNTWKKLFSTSFKYTNSRLSEKVKKFVQSLNPQGSNYQKTIYTYDNFTNSTSELGQDWINNNWEYSYRLTNYYNSNNQVDSIIQEVTWQSLQRKSFKYNSNGISEVISSIYFGPQRGYYHFYRVLFSYDSKGILESAIEESIDTSGWKVKVGNLKYNYNYQKRVGLAENSTLVDFKIFPNPTSDQITISTKGNRINQIRIVDLSGRVVFENQSTLNSNEVTIPVYHLGNGTYILTVTSNGQQKSEKIVVNH